MYRFPDERFSRRPIVKDLAPSERDEQRKITNLDELAAKIAHCRANSNAAISLACD
jgi:hypothetical protein